MRWGSHAPARRLHQHPALAVTCSCFMLSTRVSPKFQKGMEHHKQTLTRNLRPGYTLSISPLKQAHSDSLSNSCIQGTNNSPGVGHRIRPTGKKKLREYLKFKNSTEVNGKNTASIHQAQALFSWTLFAKQAARLPELLFQGFLNIRF